MELFLSISSYQKASLGQDANIRFRLRGGTIGRARDNDWVLPDTDRIVSSHHARILYEQGNYFIEDTSSNGTYLNGGERLARGEKHVLRHGDTIVIGAYDIHVRLQEQVAAEGIGQAGGGFIAKPFLHGESHDGGWNERMFGNPQYGSPLPPQRPIHPAGIANEPLPEPPHSAGAITPLGDGFVQAERVRPDLEHFVPPRAQAPIIPEVEELPPVANVLPDDWWKEEDEDQEDLQAAEPEPILDDLFAPELGQGTPPALDMTPIAPEKPASEIPPKSSQVVGSKHEKPSPPLTEGETHGVNGPFIPPYAENIPPLPEEIPPSSRAGQAVPVQPSRPLTPVEEPTPPQNRNLYSAPAQADALGREQQLVAIFLQGLGLPEVPVKAEVAETWFREMGELLRLITLGLLAVMQARMTLKSEFRLTQTIVRRTQNNPLKFSVDIDQALRLLFVDKNPGFMNADAAFAEAFSDIKQHELAVVAGMRAAFDRLLEEFKPEVIEMAQQTQGKRGALLPFSDRHWAYYKEYYQQFVARAGDEFQGIFGKDFVRAYEEQINLFEKKG